MRRRGLTPAFLAGVLIALALFISACGEDKEGTDTGPTAAGEKAKEQKADRGKDAGTDGEEGPFGNAKQLGGESAQQDTTPTKKERAAQRKAIASFRKNILTMGEEASGAERKEIIAGATAYLEAFSEADGEQACKHLTPAARTTAVQSGEQIDPEATACPQAVAAIANDTPEDVRSGLDELEVQRVRLQADDRATVIYIQPGAPESLMGMTLWNGAWRAATVTGSPLPGASEG